MNWPDGEPEVVKPCPVCQNNLRLMDAVEFDVDAMSTEAIGRKKPGKRNKKACATLAGPFRPSTKVTALLNDLVQFSKGNPHSVNYDPTSLDVQMVDDQGNIIIDDSVVKTVVLYDHTALFAASVRTLTVMVLARSGHRCWTGWKKLWMVLVFATIVLMVP
jgi:hypothetical protein